ncbi:MAG: CotH kinase family protein [Candidatus Cryptobacteroides sp.]
MKNKLNCIIRVLSCTIAILLAVSGCKKEEVSLPHIPQWYLDLLSLHRQDKVFVKAAKEGGEWAISFEDCEYRINAADVAIYDCTLSGEPDIHLDGNNEWVARGVSTGIQATKGKTLDESYPILVYLFGDTVNIAVSNGETIVFRYRKPIRAERFTMPRVKVYHNADRIHKSYAIDGSIVIEDPDGHFSDALALESTASIQGRGNSTWDMPKKPFKIKFPEKHSVLGMPSNKSWVFLANYSDKSLLRNIVGMTTSGILEMQWTPQFRIVEVWINDDYQGVYNLFEKKDVGKNKVNIDVEAGDVYLEIESSFDEPKYFFTGRCSVPIQFKEPNAPTDEQFGSIVKLFNDFEAALLGPEFKDPSRGYAAYIDVDSFIDNFIIRELAKDIDGNVRKSSFLTVVKSTGKIKFCHVWDFDISYGNANYFPGDMSECNGDPNGPYGWYVRDYNSNCVKADSWYNRLFKDPEFVKKVKTRWAEVYPGLKRMPEYIDKYSTEMGDAVSRNFIKWNILNEWVWPNVKVTGSYAGELEWLEEFYMTRLEWLDSKF